ncbi:hypothetical protein SBE55_24330 [Mycolicibacterium sp. 141076]|uniref:hypothetical protein n=1 Tax=Mycolicibacterium sp. 141076 TaxID=3090599 RepID=UPI00299E3A35|nr:hypothetical protein [Mycolicibacterium sp. 141076]MDX1880944.1 hypothetical protein [Mycolicibacterium sp. 141076]
MCYFQSKPGLADTARSGEGDQPRLGQHPLGCFQIMAASHKSIQRRTYPLAASSLAPR